MTNKRASATRPRIDHRTRVGQRRRARTRSHIIGTALAVFAEKGPDAPVIDDFIRAAGVARGTFYNYFTSTQELLDAVTKTLEDSVMSSTLAAMAHIDDPVLRLSTGIRIWLRWAQSDAIGCGFVVRSRFRGPLVEKQLAADLSGGLEAGKFRFPSVEIARDLLVGTILEAMHRMMTSEVPDSFTDEVAGLILQGVGLDKRAIDRLLARPLPRFEQPDWETAA
ncbi:MAG: TetR/AcrR family transcriptional regulator [Steroidobacteraceae bacterium]|jgi:AcrR family transcriptional regulator|nr:TetR/AcrR family transcriptional regulator [Steroidobacteraceae bacterium]